MSNAICPCCSSTLLRHIRPAGIYWYCSHCHQEMPNLSQSFRVKAKAKSSLSLVEKPSNFLPDYIDLINQKAWLRVANSA
ncbi:hypothetical protein [Planktothrix sp. FACHB-1365]|uniref:hypothetical protein n=1 Tax=Planktothrix sp. FACHB-1365 TaxID=2692855 RepID=UPI001687AE3D|nr:hypothetical protein [Planktothrix sp. FACHB-1365]MBD2482893.1 hypothetical protein [Planktothrix sp. FACHB-1365]